MAVRFLHVRKINKIPSFFNLPSQIMLTAVASSFITNRNPRQHPINQ